MDRNKKAEMIECACGCGISMPKYDSQKRERKFIMGHYGRKFLASYIRKPMSQKTKDKISIANKGKKNSEETRKKISIANAGRKISKEERKMRSESAKAKGMGKWMKQVWAEGRASPNSLKAIASKDRSYLIGKPLSAEHRKKLSNSRQRGLENGSIKIWNKGMKDPFPISEATRKKISIANTGSKRTEEQKKNISKACLGRIVSEAARKKISATQQGVPLEKWNRFISFEPYDKEFNNRFKKAIRKRDNQICILCNIHREKLNKALAVHHIDYNKKLSIPQNCISLCASCHVKTNNNRTHWIKFFQSLLSERYNYNYSEDNMTIINIGEQKNRI